MKNDKKKPTNLTRALKTRHLTMIAVGGSIGTGLFVASGASIAQSGPGGALVAYAVVGIMVYLLMTSLGELAACMPISGSFASYSAKYVEDGFGFAIGWIYWYNWAVTIAVDLVAAQLIMQFWFPDVNPLIWSAVSLAIIFTLNYVSVRNFGESEYWFALIKVIAIAIFIALGLAMIVGIFKSDSIPVGWENFTIADAPFVGGIPTIIGVAMIVAFAFQGTELIGIAAGESSNPATAIPKATRQVFWRILLFYVLSIFVIGMIVPYTDPNLLRNDTTDIAFSPFTLVLQKSGIAFAASIMNAVVLTSVLSSGNSGMYASTRMLYALAREGKAPKFLTKLSSNGVPFMALYATSFVALLCFLTSTFENKDVYIWLLSMAGIAGLIAWLGIAISHYRFRKGFVIKGGDISKLPYVSKFYPFGPILAFILCAVIIGGQGIEAMGENKTLDWKQLLAAYIGLILFIIMWGSYKIVNKSKLVKYEEMNFDDVKFRKK